MTTKNGQNGWQARWFHLALWGAIITVFILFLRAVQPILLPFVLGMFIAYLMDPFTRRLEKRFKLKRAIATAIVTFTFFATIVGLVVWLVPILYDQAISLSERAPAMLQDLSNNARAWSAPLLQKLNALSGNSPNPIPKDTTVLAQRAIAAVGVAAGSIFSSGAALINVMALLLITPIVCFYLIRDWPAVMMRADALLPRAYAPVIREQLRLINRTLAAYLRGQLVVIAILAVFYVAGLMLSGLNYGLVLGLLAAVIVVIPYLGSLISVSLGLMVAYGQFGTEGAFWFVVVVYAAGQILESQILTPKIIGDRVGLHPLWMLFGMLAGAVLLGFVGVLLAVPLTAVIGVLAKFAINRYLQSGLYLDD